MQENKIRTNPVSIVAAACVCMGWLLVVPNGAVAEKLRVGINLTTIETLPIYLVEREPAGEGIELSGGAIPSLTAGNADVVTNAETQAILRSTANPEIRVILTVAEYRYRIVARRSAGVRTAMDLRGKKIATPFLYREDAGQCRAFGAGRHRCRDDASANAGGARAR